MNHDHTAEADKQAHDQSLGTATDIVRKRPDGEPRVRSLFQKFSQKTSAAVGTPWAFIVAVLVIVAWAGTGPIFHYSDTWQLVINTGTTIVTFLMVFLIQNTQNRDAKAIHLKLDELIRAKKGARNTLVDLENCTDEELEEIEHEFKRLRDRAGRHHGHHPEHEHEHHDEHHDHAPVAASHGPAEPHRAARG
jgi:low affinity Fe/Cu permease